MNRLPRGSIAAALALSVSLGAVAVSSPYVALRGSLAFPGDMESTLLGSQLRTSMDTGWNASIALGQDSEWLGLRLELEGIYGKFTPNKVTSGAVSTSISGDVDMGASMVNAVWDIPVERWWPDADLVVRPFVGAGLGAVYVALNPQSAGVIAIDQDDTWTWGYQLTAGFAVPLSQTTDLTFQYRYLDAPNVSLHGVTGATYKTSFSMSSIGMGLEFRF